MVADVVAARRVLLAGVVLGMGCQLLVGGRLRARLPGVLSRALCLRVLRLWR